MQHGGRGGRMVAWGKAAAGVAVLGAVLLGSIRAGAQDPAPPSLPPADEPPGREIRPADALLDVSRIEPSPVVIEQTATLRGRGFGERGSLEIHLVSYADGIDRPTPIADGQILSWTDTAIELRLPIRSEGRYYLRLSRGSGDGSVLRGGELAGVDFSAVLPRPMITSYEPRNACPGQLLSIRGSGFTHIRGAFTLLWDKTGPERTSGITLRTDRVTAWTDDHIRLRVPTDLPVYIAPGEGFRISLAVRGDRGLDPRASGPEGRIPASCAERAGSGPTRIETLPGNQRPSLRPRGATRLGLPVQPGIGGSGPLALRFDVAPMPQRAVVGNTLAFGGTFRAGPALVDELRERHAQVEWSIQRGNALVRSGIVDVRGRSTPWLQRVEADQPGSYRLEMRLLGGGPEGATFSPDLSGARVTVGGVARPQEFDPGAGQAPGSGLPQGALPPPQGLEPARP